MEKDGKELVRRWTGAWITNDPGQVDALFSAQYTVNGQPVGREGVKRALDSLHGAFGGLSLEIEDLLAEGKKVAVRWTLHGVHRGEFMGIAPTGRRIAAEGINIYEIADGRILSNYEQTTFPSLVQELGADP